MPFVCEEYTIEQPLRAFVFLVRALGFSPKALGGYAFGLETKQYLLRLEGVL